MNPSGEALSRPVHGPSRCRLGVRATSTRGRTPGSPIHAVVGGGSVQGPEGAGQKTPADSVPCRGALTTDDGVRT